MKRILIVDDEPHVIRVLRLCLQREGYEVDSVSEPRAAIEKLRTLAPDVLITDIQMPGMTGKELCEYIQAELPQREFLVLVMTSMTARENRQWVSKMANTEFLEKPLSPRSLILRLSAYFAAAPAAAGA